MMLRVNGQWGRRLHLAIILLSIAGLSYLLWQGLKANPNYQPPLHKLKALPDFSLPNALCPEQLITPMAWQGQPALIHIWASWCQSCIAEHKMVQQIHQAYDWPIYGVVYQDDMQMVQQWLAHQGNPYQSLVADEQGSLVVALGTLATPEWLVLDAKGVIHLRHLGPLTEKKFKQQFLPLLQHLKQEHL
jgi:cytochrome c biogenesis protein CcmG/thiol:disulfide interchange protein DsbE